MRACLLQKAFDKDAVLSARGSHDIDKTVLNPYIWIVYIDGLVQERRNSSVLAMELRLSFTNPSILK